MKFTTVLPNEAQFRGLAEHNPAQLRGVIVGSSPRILKKKLRALARSIRSEYRPVSGGQYRVYMHPNGCKAVVFDSGYWPVSKRFAYTSLLAAY